MPDDTLTSSAALTGIRGLIAARDDAAARTNWVEGDVAEFNAAQDKLAASVPSLVAAVEAVLALADDWDRETAKLDLKADQADRTVPRERTASALMSARAQALEGCGRELREAITSALTGQERSNG